MRFDDMDWQEFHVAGSGTQTLIAYGVGPSDVTAGRLSFRVYVTSADENGARIGGLVSEFIVPWTRTAEGVEVGTVDVGAVHGSGVLEWWAVEVTLDGEEVRLSLEREPEAPPEAPQGIDARVAIRCDREALQL